MTSDAAHECYGNEHRTQHQHNCHNGSGHLVHGSLGGIFGVHFVDVHVAFDVFDHHDRIVHHDADGQDHAKQGQHVDREAQCGHANECTDDGNRHGQHRDQGGAQTLQEGVNHNHDQHQRLEEGVHHLRNGGSGEGGCVHHNLVFDALRKSFLHLRQGRRDRIGDIQRIGAGLLINRHQGRWLSLVRAAQ